MGDTVSRVVIINNVIIFLRLVSRVYTRGPIGNIYWRSTRPRGDARRWQNTRATTVQQQDRDGRRRRLRYRVRVYYDAYYIVSLNSCTPAARVRYTYLFKSTTVPHQCAQPVCVTRITYACVCVCV